jgi:hypothetical protein
VSINAAGLGTLEVKGLFRVIGREEILGFSSGLGKSLSSTFGFMITGS